jgi:hypothetical protein
MGREPFPFLLLFLVPALLPLTAGGGALTPQEAALAGVPAEIPLWLKLAYSAFVAVLVPVYWVRWGPGNFLWFSDLALFGALAAVWLESSLLASMMTVAVLLPEAAWNIGFFGRLLFNRDPFGLTGYMFDASRPLYLRALSLFHVILPPLLLWLLYQLGYDARAWYYQTALAWVVLPLSYWLTDPKENVNWVYGPGEEPQTKIPPLLYLGAVMLFFPLVVYLPTHWLMGWLFT